LEISAIILAGGFGTRLHMISKGIPKSLMAIGDSKFLDLLIEKLFFNGVSHIYLSLYYKSELFKNYIDKSKFKMKLSYIVEPERLGTGGAINYVLNNSNISSQFFVINGDSFSDINLNEMIKEFNNSQYKAMIGISEVKDAERYGTVKVHDGNVVEFNEKGISGPGWINNGYYILKSEIFEEHNGFFSLEKKIFPHLARNYELGAFKVKNDTFIDIGIPEDYEQLCNLFKS
tara:strand:+ start:147 stop:839 length:693 start_codon:yes stop_codon:yes gene_type:complete